MFKVINYGVYGIPFALYAMRNPLESWPSSDTEVGILEQGDGSMFYGDKYTLNEYLKYNTHGGTNKFFDNYYGDKKASHTDFGRINIGEKDRRLALKLIKAGTDHRKYLRFIDIVMTIKAPMSWWWDLDTYKVGTTKLSTSRMHKFGTRKLTQHDFDFKDLRTITCCPTYDDWSGELLEYTDFENEIINEINKRINKISELRENGVAEDVLRTLWLNALSICPQSYLFTATWKCSYETALNIVNSKKNHKQSEFDELIKFWDENLPLKEFIGL